MTYFKYKNKKVYYKEIGTGEPLIMLHGNTASSKMFDSIIDLYKDNFKLILIDFLGHGRSDRLDDFVTDFWFDQAMQVISFCDYKGYHSVNLLGSSGGALAAINVALERPDLVSKLVADSFEGEQSIDSFADLVVKDRSEGKSNDGAISFWTYMHGDDWEHVVDLDTQVIIKHHKLIRKFFHKDISTLEMPTLLLGTKEDEYCRDIVEVYSVLLSRINNCRIHLFPEGGHPAVITSAEAFSVVVKDFLKNS